MAGNRDLNFNIGAIERTGKAFEKIALRLKRLERELDILDRKRVNVKVDVDTDRARRRIGGFADAASASTAGAVRGLSTFSYLVIGAVAAALAALPAVGALAATGIVAVFGAGLAGVGLAAAAQSKKVKDAFRGLKKDLGKELKDAAKPFEATLLEVERQSRRVFDALDLDTLFGRMAPAVTRFTTSLGDAFTELAPALKPVTDAFNDFLDELGPQLGPLFGQIGKALTDLSETFSENKTLLTGLFVGVLKVIPRLIEFINFLTEAFVFLAPKVVFAASVLAGFVATGISSLRLLAIVAIEAFGTILEAAAQAFKFTPLGPQLAAASEKFNAWGQGVIDTLGRAEAKARDWQVRAAKLAKQIKIQANIDDLEAKLRRAKRQIKDPTISKATRKRLQGDITHLKRKIREAKAALAGVKDRTVTLFVRRVNQTLNLPMLGRATGQASGGPVLSGRTYLVGERGPEIIRMGSNTGTVIPNRKVAGALDGGGHFEGELFLDSGQFLGMVRGEIREANRDTKRRSLAGAGGAR